MDGQEKFDEYELIKDADVGPMDHIDQRNGEETKI